MERRLAAIFAADVKGYSHLTERDEASTATLRAFAAIEWGWRVGFAFFIGLLAGTLDPLEGKQSYD